MTAYCPQTNGQVKRNNKTIVARLKRFVADLQRDSNIFVQPCTCVYNTQVHRSTNTFPYRLVLSHIPLGLSLLRAAATESAPRSQKPHNSKCVRCFKLAFLHSAARWLPVCGSHKQKNTITTVQYVKKQPHTHESIYSEISGHYRTFRTRSRKCSAGNLYGKLQSKTTEPFRIVIVQKKTATFDEDGMQNTASTYRMTHKPSRTRQSERTTISSKTEFDQTRDPTPSEARDSHTDKD